MKKTFIVGALALGLASPLLANNDNDPKILIVGPENKQFGVLVEDDTETRFSLKVLSDNGEILYREHNKEFNYAKRFDLGLLEKGNYRLEVESEKLISSFPIKVKDNKLVISSDQKMTISKPQIQNDGLKMRLKMETGNLPVEVSILDRYDRLIHNQEYRDMELINTLFDFRRHGKGEYRVVVRFNSRSFSETVTLHQ